MLLKMAGLGSKVAAAPAARVLGGEARDGMIGTLATPQRNLGFFIVFMVCSKNWISKNWI